MQYRFPGFWWPEDEEVTVGACVAYIAGLVVLVLGLLLVARACASPPETACTGYRADNGAVVVVCETLP